MEISSAPVWPWVVLRFGGADVLCRAELEAAQLDGMVPLPERFRVRCVTRLSIQPAGGRMNCAFLAWPPEHMKLTRGAVWFFSRHVELMAPAGEVLAKEGAELWDEAPKIVKPDTKLTVIEGGLRG